MGISGLIPLVKAASTDVKLDRLKGNTNDMSSNCTGNNSFLLGSIAAIDTNGWIHRACYSCGDKIYMNEETDMYINYCVNFAQVLKDHSICPILVFDGQSLPAKSETKIKRQERKQAVRDQIESLISQGDMRGARYLMRTCVDVNFEIVHKVIERCRLEGIDCIVAPFEADAQIVYLVNSGIADFAITEDSDMLAFGCKKTLLKLDRDSAKGKMVDLEKLNKCFKNFDQQKFQLMCILSGKLSQEFLFIS